MQGSVIIDVLLRGPRRHEVVEQMLPNVLPQLSSLHVRQVLVGEFGFQLHEDISFNPPFNKTYRQGQTFWIGALKDEHERGSPYYCPVGEFDVNVVIRLIFFDCCCCCTPVNSGHFFFFKIISPHYSMFEVKSLHCILLHYSPLYIKRLDTLQHRGP